MSSNDQKDGLKKRMRDLRDHFGFRTNKQYSEAVGVSESNLKRILKDGTIGQRSIVSICESLQISTEWLRYGQGPMMASDAWVHDRRDGDPIDPSAYAYIPKANLVLSAGGGLEALEGITEERYAFRLGWLRGLNISSIKNLLIMDVRGDSMSEIIPNGSVVLVDIGQTDIKSGSYYAIREGGFAELKRLVVCESDMIEIQPRSLDEKTFRPRTVHKSDIEVLAKVLWSGVTFP